MGFAVTAIKQSYLNTCSTVVLHSLTLAQTINPFQPKLILVHTAVTGTCRRAYKHARTGLFVRMLGDISIASQTQKSQRSVLR